MRLIAILMLIFLVSITASNLYGMFKRESWFWGDGKELSEDSAVSFNNMFNPYLNAVFGKWGVFIFNIGILLILWWGFIHLFFFQIFQKK